MLNPPPPVNLDGLHPTGYNRDENMRPKPPEGAKPMKACILRGVLVKRGILPPCWSRFERSWSIGERRRRPVWLYDREIRPCVACRSCQRDWTIFGCPQRDDGQALFDLVLGSELVVLATPIYAWYCTPPMKALLDRLVYGMNKYYGEAKGPALWAGKAMALLMTCGYPAEKGCDLFEEGMRRYCRHSRLRYLGAHVERHLGYGTVFMDGEKEDRARLFAWEVMKRI